VTAADAAPAPPRIGVFGGAFDPPHRAHRAVAEAALQQLMLDRLLIVPTGQAWHKTRPLTAAEHRLAMCELAFGDLARVSIDARETRRSGPTYTVDTLRELHAEHPRAALYLVVGADQWLALRTWHRWEDILRLATVAVANRPLAGEDAALPDLSAVGLPFVPLRLPPIDLSATALRARWQAGDAGNVAAALVLPAVARYISERRLYRTTGGATDSAA